MELFERQIAFHITSCCTLNCKLCSVLIPYGKKIHALRHIPYEQIVKDIRECFSIYHFIEDVTISGGEPLMHPALPQILKYCMQFSEQFRHLRIFSNGSIYPSAQLVAILKEYPHIVELVIDHYGPRYSVKAEEIIKDFCAQSIPLRVNKYFGEEQHCNGWVDLGDPQISRNLSDEALQQQFLNCHPAQYKCLTVYNGQLSNCATALFGYEFGLYPNGYQHKSKDIIDISDESSTMEEKKERASKLGKFPLYACQFCNGYDSLNSIRFPAAEQTGS